MAQYIYKIVKDEKVTKGEFDAKSKKEVATFLQNQGYQVLSIEQKNLFNSPGSLNINIGGVPQKEKTIFLRQLAYMIQAGLPINQALETLSTQVKNAQFKKVITKIGKEVQEGTSLSEAFERQDKVFDKVIINLIKAGEESGNLAEILDRVSYDYEKKQEFSGKVKGALIYPGVILVVVIGVVALLMIVMIPSIKSLFENFSADGKSTGKQLPFLTQAMISLSDFLVVYWWLILVLMVVSFIGYKYYSKTPGGRVIVDKFKLKVPIFGNLTRLSQIAEFARGLAMLLRSGVPIVRSMNLIAESMENQLFADEVAAAARRLEKGVILSQSISKDSPFTPIVFQMLAIGEQTGQTDSTLSKLADYYEKEVSQVTNNLTKILEPIILLLMGGVILLIALAVYLPIYTLGG